MRIRPTARVLVIDEQERLLLFHIHDSSALHEAYPEMMVYWLPPGGGLEEGETFAEAAERELWEETGIVVEALGGCVWQNERLLNLSNGQMLIQEQFFLARVSAPQVHLGNLLPYEQETHRGYRWWSLAEIAESTDYFLPRDLAERLRPLLAAKSA